MPGEESFDDRLAAAADLAQLVRRLRSLSPRAWQDRHEAVRVALAGLVALDAQLEGRELAPPSLADHMLADAIAVVGGDVLASLSGERAAELAEFTRLLEAALGQTR